MLSSCVRVQQQKQKQQTSQQSKMAVQGDRIHLIVFMHGFEGTANDFDNAEKAFLKTAERISQASPEGETIKVLKPRGNSGFAGTYDGVEKGAVRIWREVMTQVNTLGGNLKTISLIGHSLGGIYARYLARLLDDCFLFEQIEPRFFITLATPHLSVRRPQNGPVNFVFQNVAKVLNKTASELCLEDDSTQPILYKMTEDSYISVLRKFKRRILYANVANDFQVHYSTASISMENPYSKDPAKSKRSKKFPDLTEWSLMTSEERRQHELDALDEFARRDERARLLRAMFVRLNDLEWERYDAIFNTVFAHEQIINKRSIFAGKHVIKHLCEIFFDMNGSSAFQATGEENETRDSELVDAEAIDELQPPVQLSQI